MESHHHHETHDHGAHGAHGAHQHGAVAHQPAADADEAYRRAYAAAQPDPGRRVVPVELEAREIDWQFSPGTTTRAWGYNGQIPGPVIDALIVRGEGEPQLDAERVLVLDDVRLDKNGQVAAFGGIVEHHDGREGDTRLVNGVAEPVLKVAAGQIERWRVVNASSARYIRLSVGGAPFKILGTDGGLLEAPVTVTDVLLATADRVDIAVGPFAEGQELAVEALQYFRRTIQKRKTERFATLHVGPAQPSSARIPERLRTIAPLAPPTATPNRTVKLGITLSLRRMVDFVINRERHHQDQPVKAGELQVWDIVNTTLMDHPFHLHGFFFQVLSIDGEAPPWRSWEDVVNVPPRATVRIAWMPDERPGSWMYHCHILEHHASGMMGHFDVVS